MFAAAEMTMASVTPRILRPVDPVGPTPIGMWLLIVELVIKTGEASGGENSLNFTHIWPAFSLGLAGPGTNAD